VEQRKLGSSGIQVGAIGLGCMGMSDFYGPTDDIESLATLNLALDQGVTFLDTADMYGFGKNEELVGQVVRKRRQDVVLATKFGFVRDPSDPTKRAVNGRPDYVVAACDASLKRLGVDVIDLYYPHRVDPAVPIEETVGAMADLVRAGKVRALGLSEAAAETVRRANAVHPIAALQSEYSLWTREPEDGVLATCRSLNIAFVAYSPLGRGFLTGAIRKVDDLTPTADRRHAFRATRWRRISSWSSRWRRSRRRRAALLRSSPWRGFSCRARTSFPFPGRSGAPGSWKTWPQSTSSSARTSWLR